MVKEWMFLFILGASVSVQLTVDPAHPRVLPECKFLGSDQGLVYTYFIILYHLTSPIFSVT
jgi:hypothetical protein